MLWIALHPPALPLQACEAALGATSQPLALLDAHRIQAANAPALQLGIKPGQKRATALALAPQLQFGQADAARETQALHALAHVALAFTPTVTLDGSGVHACVLLEVQASLRYFGGLARLQQRLRAALEPLGLRVRLASAPTALGAALLARWRDGLAAGAHSTRLDVLQRLLDQAPLALLAAGREHALALAGMGLQRLGDVRRLPRDGLARRFGEGLLHDLDRARGERADPREALEPPVQFDAKLELLCRADSAEQLLAGAGMLLAQLVAWAQARHARVGAFRLRMRHETRHRGDAAEHSDLDIALAEASNDAAHLQLLLRERLAQLALPAPTLELQLHCSRLHHQPAPNGELFASAAGAREGLTRLIERLQARLGPRRVMRPVLCPDHRPERGTAWQPAMAPLPARVDQATVLSVRPVWLLSEAEPLHERQSRPLLDGRPLQLLAGPQRIEAGWWDGAAAVRDYFIAQAHDGALVWVYRSRLALPAGEGWFLHGRFG